MTTIVLGAVGAAVGFAIGGPFGASIGWSLGALAGNALDPQRVQGPRLTDLRLQGSAYGAFEPIVYGTVRLAGNVIWQTNLREHERTSGGKGGGGPKVTSYSYSASFDVLICEAPAGAVIKMWAYGRAVYGQDQAIGNGNEVPVTFYYGGESQLPDPTEEAATGVGLTPAYRGVVRAMLTDWDLTQFSNQIPALEFLVSSAALPSGAIRLVKDNTDDPPTWSPEQVIATWDTDLGDDTPLGLPTTGDAPPLVYIEVSGGFEVYYYVATDGFVCADGTEFSLWTDRKPPYINDAGQNSAMSVTRPILSNDTTYVVTTPFKPADLPFGIHIVGMATTPDRKTLLLLGSDDEAGQVQHWYLVQGIDASSIRVVNSGTVTGADRGYAAFGRASFICPGPAESSITPHDHACCVLEPGGEYLWVYNGVGGHDISGDNIRYFHIDPTTQVMSLAATAGPSPGFDSYPAIWCFRDGYIGTIGHDGPGGSDYNQAAIWTRFTSDAATITLAEIVSDLCLRSGLSLAQIDVSDLTDRVRGFVVSQQMAGRAAIESLMPAFFFDAVESDNVLKFVKRGRPSLVTIPDADLGAHDAGGELPALLSFVRTQEVDLPASMTIIYFDYEADYQLGSQIAQRMVTSSQLTVTVQQALVMTAAEAKAVVDTWLYNAWNERDTYTWYTTRKYAKYEPTDVVTVRGVVLRIMTKNESASGVIKWSGVRAQAGVLVQLGVGGQQAGAPPAVVPVEQATEVLLLDIPTLTGNGTQGFYRPAMQGAERRSWIGASLQKSVDGGTTYDEVLNTDQPDTIGEGTTVLHNFDGINLFDESNAVTVLIHPGGGELASAAEADVLNGANLALLGGEVIQYKLAELVADQTYTLSGLLRGRFGTEWAQSTHVVGEPFVVLPTVNVLASLDSDRATVRKYKAITANRALSTAAVTDFADTGVSRLPLSPVQLGTGVDAAGNYYLQWLRRARVNFLWQAFVVPPVDEASELYEVTFYTDSTLSTIAGSIGGIGTPSFVFTTALQTSIYGSPLGAPPYWSVAQIGAIGPGYNSLGQAPAVTLVVPQPAAPPASATNVPPWNGVTWFDTFRFLNGGSPLTNAMKNANYLAINFHTNYMFAYCYASHVGMSGALQTEFVTQGLGLDNADLILNTVAGQGRYQPPGWLVLWSPHLQGGGSTPYTGSPTSPPSLICYAGGLANMVTIPLPYPDDANT